MRRFLLACAALLVVLAPGAGAQATAYVPNQDAAYADLDVLIAAGIVREVITGERPYSRAAFERFVREAKHRAATNSLAPRLQESLQRLDARFGDPGTNRSPLASSEARFTAAASPPRPARGLANDGDLDADINPFLEGNEGRRLADGATASIQAGASIGSRFLAAQLTPRVSMFAPRSRPGFAGEGALVAGYGRLVVAGIGLDVGRNNVAFGHGVLGGPMLSQNARGLDMIRLAADRPVRLPFFLRYLGMWQPSIGFADLGPDRDEPGSWLALMRLSARPSQYLEYGISYFNIQGGKNAPPADYHRRVHDLFFFWTDGGYLEISDKIVGADVRILVPQLRASVNVNFLTTDDRGHFRQPACGCWQDAVWQVGGDVRGVGAEGRNDFAVEWTHAGPRAHTHGQFSSGVTLDRRTLGSVLGPNAFSVTTQWTRHLTDASVRVMTVYERYSSDDWHAAIVPGGGMWDYQWYRDRDNPDEIRWRVGAEFARNPGLRRVETTWRAGYEHVERFNFGTTSRHNFVVELAIRRSR